MAHELPPLPYGYDALAPTINERTMQLHHDFHHQAYVNNYNAAVEKLQAAVAEGTAACSIKLPLF